MFAFSVTFKLLSWYLALRYGDTGRPSRPWILGAIVGLVFGIFDATSQYRVLQNNVILFVIYLVAALIIMNIYYRIHSIVLSLVVIAVGTFVLFLGIPYFCVTMIDAD
jgi:type III secretory pathway component EscS